jgi:hypothetical protein
MYTDGRGLELSIFDDFIVLKKILLNFHLALQQSYCQYEDRIHVTQDMDQGR